MATIPNPFAGTWLNDLFGGSEAPATPTGSSTNVDSQGNPVPALPTYKFGVPNAVAYSGNGGQPPKSDPATADGGGVPTFEDFLASIGLSGGVPTGTAGGAPDLTAGVQDQYSSVLDFLKRSVDRTENQGEKASNNLGDIYSAMAQMNKQSGKAIAKQGKKSAKQIQGVYERAGDARDKSIEKDSGAVARRLKELGISAALPASTERMMKESGQDHRLIARQEGRAVSNAQNNAANWANFAKAGAQGARLEGAEQRSQISQNVADLVFQLQGQIAQTKADKAAAMMQAQQAEYGMAQDAAQAAAAAQMQEAGLAQQYQQMMMEAQSAGSGTSGSGEPATGFDLITQILRNENRAEPGVNRGDVSTAVEAMQGIIPAITGQTDQYSGQVADPTAQDFYSQLASQAEAAGINPELYRALMSKQIYDQFYGSGG